MRNRAIDVARGICIISIIYAHLNIFLLMRILNPFFLVTFFVVSGYFMNRKKPVGIYIKDRFRKLLVPYFFTSIFMVVVPFFIGLYQNGLQDGLNQAGQWLYAALYGSGITYDYPFYIKGIGPIWFLWAIFWASCFLRTSLEMKWQWRLVFILGLYLFGIYSRDLLFNGWMLWLPLSLQAGSCDAFFMYIGFLIKPILPKLKGISKEIRVLFYIICGALWLNLIINFEVFGPVNNEFNRGIIDVVAALGACVVVFKISQLIARYLGWFGDWIGFIGEYSILFLCIHNFEFLIVDWYSLFSRIFPFGLSYYRLMFLMVPVRLIILTLLVWWLIRYKWVQKIFSIRPYQKRKSARATI